MASFKDRIIGSARLNPGVYEDVEADKGATGQAISVVALSSIAAGIGAISKGGGAGIAAGLIAAFAGWLIWASLTYVIGAKLFPEATTSANMGEMLRTIGFSSSPGLIRIFGIIPGMTEIVFFISAVWMFAAMVVAVRQALDYTSTFRAAGVCFAGWLVQALIIGSVFYMTSSRAL